MNSDEIIEEIDTIEEIDKDTTEEKKEKKENKADFKGFLQHYFWIIIVGLILVGVVLFGSITLFLTKISTSNILPTDVEQVPFTDVINDTYKEIEIIMNPVKIRTWFGLGFWDYPTEVYSQKAKFDYEEFINSFKNGWINKLTNYANNPKKKLSNLALFMSEVLNPLTANSFGILTNIFKLFNYLPEWVTMLFGSLILFFSFIIIYGYNFILSIFYHLINLKQYFRVPSQGEWESEDSISFLRIIKLILFSFIWWWVSLISLFVSPIIVTIYTLMKSLTAKYYLAKSNEENGFLSFLIDNIIYKKSFLLTLATIGLMNSTSLYLGNNYMFGLILGIIIVMYSFNLYSPSVPYNDPTQTIGMKQSGGTKTKCK
jgi:hypothetical protein